MKKKMKEEKIHKKKIKKFDDEDEMELSGKKGRKSLKKNLK